VSLAVMIPVRSTSDCPEARIFASCSTLCTGEGTLLLRIKASTVGRLRRSVVSSKPGKKTSSIRVRWHAW
jgi:hypothetical protein